VSARLSALRAWRVFSALLLLSSVVSMVRVVTVWGVVAIVTGLVLIPLITARIRTVKRQEAGCS